MADDANKGGEKVSPGAVVPAASGNADMVQVSVADLAAIQEQLRSFELREAEREAKYAGLEAIVAAEKGADASGDGKLREKKNYEPKFRTVRLRKFPIAGSFENKGIVTGWSNRGAYQEVDRSGVAPAIVDFIDVQFLDHEKNSEGKLQFEKVKLLDLLGKCEQVQYKILDVKKTPQKEATNEEINVTVYDPQHGMMSTGDIIDGYTAFTDIEYVIDIPGHAPVTIDGLYVN